MGLNNCHNFKDFRKLAKRRLPGPIFHYIDGAADDEQTYRRNTEAYGDVDLVPNVLAGVDAVDMSVEVMGQKLDMPVYCAPTALGACCQLQRDGAYRGHHHWWQSRTRLAYGLHLSAQVDAIFADQLCHTSNVGLELPDEREVRHAASGWPCRCRDQPCRVRR